jgi:hypothetical protein
MSSASVKRILKEAALLDENPLADIHAAPLESDVFCWHFVGSLQAFIRGNTDGK